MGQRTSSTEALVSFINAFSGDYGEAHPRFKLELTPEPHHGRNPVALAHVGLPRALCIKPMPHHDAILAFGREYPCHGMVLVVVKRSYLPEQIRQKTYEQIEKKIQWLTAH